MALKIRLTRMGDKGNPFYRVVVAEGSAPRDGKFVEILGTFDPSKADPKEGIKINAEVATSWIAKGALPTDTARAVLEKAGIVMEKPKAKVSTPKPKAPVEKKKKN